MLRIYQLTLSPLLGPRCRYYPSCSNYAMTAVRTHGFWRGLWLSAKRLGRCHPGHPGGIDEVPGVPARKNQVPGNRVLRTQTRCACSSDLTNQ